MPSQCTCRLPTSCLSEVLPLQLCSEISLANNGVSEGVNQTGPAGIGRVQPVFQNVPQTVLGGEGIRIASGSLPVQYSPSLELSLATTVKGGIFNLLNQNPRKRPGVFQIRVPKDGGGCLLQYYTKPLVLVGVLEIPNISMGIQL